MLAWPRVRQAVRLWDTELDLMLTYNFTEQTQFRFGYSYFWAGEFYDTTPGVPTNTNASFLYSHISYQF